MLCSTLRDLGDLAPLVAIVAGGCAAGAHWLRFRVPITPAVGAGLGVACLSFLLGHYTQILGESGTIIALCSGVIIFLWAMRWDMSDTQRQTRRSDVAFWLHLLAAPLLVHPVFSILVADDGNVGFLQASAIFAAYGALAVVSLLIDRRALMVSALGYVIFALHNLFEQNNVTTSFAATCAVVGATLIFLSIFWGRARALFLQFLPVSFALRLPSSSPYSYDKAVKNEAA